MTKKRKKVKKFNLIDWLDENVFIKEYIIWYFLLVCTLIIAQYRIEEHWLVQRGISTTGVVAGYGVSKTGVTVRYRYIVPGIDKVMRGRVPDGSKHVGRKTVPEKFKIGDTLKIVYDSKHPDRSREWNFLYENP